MSLTFGEILSAHRRISRYIHKTPVFTNTTITGRQVYFKAECLQKTGSFKVRGALNAIQALREDDPNVPGVITHSSGNHGQAVAWAAHLSGLPCTVIVPRDTSLIKQEAIQEYGADLVHCEPSPTSRFETCDRLSRERGQIIIPPYDMNNVIAGQGTIAVELLEQVPDLDAIIVPISGGGLISGIATASKYLKPSIKVFAVEPKGKMLEKCLRAGERLWPDPPQFLDTIADGIKTQQVGKVTWPIVQELVEKEVFTVDDDDIIEGMKFSFQRMKLIIEASAGAAVAAMLSDKMRHMDPDLKKIGVILCGGNVDILNLPWN